MKVWWHIQRQIWSAFSCINNLIIIIVKQLKTNVPFADMLYNLLKYNFIKPIFLCCHHFVFIFIIYDSIIYCIVLKNQHHTKFKDATMNDASAVPIHKFALLSCWSIWWQRVESFEKELTSNGRLFILKFKKGTAI